MAEFGKIELRKARESRGYPRWKLANEIGVSEDTLERWENPKSTAMPTIEDVDRIGDVLDDPQLWHNWMASNFDSYRRRYGSAKDYGLTAAILRSRHEMGDVMRLQDKVERDAIDGTIDDPHLKAEYIREVNDTISALRQILDYLQGSQGNDPFNGIK